MHFIKIALQIVLKFPLFSICDKNGTYHSNKQNKNACAHTTCCENEEEISRFVNDDFKNQFETKNREKERERKQEPQQQQQHRDNKTQFNLKSIMRSLDIIW